MGKYLDYMVKFDPDKETDNDLVKKIFYSLFINRAKHKKPTNIFFGGESGEGKSLSAITTMQILFELQGIEIKDYFQDVNIMTPFEYPRKLDKILFELPKAVNCCIMHEAREIVKAKKWQEFLSQAVADVNAQSRTIKRIIFIIISQFIRDITTDIRYTLNYYITAYRPLGKKTRLTINVMWKDDRDLEKPKLRKRRIKGIVMYPDGSSKVHSPRYIEVDMPDKYVVEMFEKMDRESKTAVIRRKLDRLIKEMEVEGQNEDVKINAMVDYYAQHIESSHLIGKTKRNKWCVKPEIKLMHGLTDSEASLFEERFNEKLKSSGRLAEVKEAEING